MVLTIIIVVLLVLIAVLAIGGAIAMARRSRSLAGRMLDQLAEANEHLARAHAEDKGWDRATMEAAARAALAERFGDVQVTDLHLVQVVDRPGTDDDQAVFRAETPDGQHTITLGRRNGAWVAA